MKARMVLASLMLICMVAAIWGCGAKAASRHRVERDKAMAQTAAPGPAPTAAERRMEMTDRAAGSALVEGEIASDEASSLGTLTASQPDRYLIKNGSVRIEVENAATARDALIAAVQAQKGYVGDLRESVSGYEQRMITLTIRIPADQFDGAVAQFAQLGKVLDLQISTQDVTEEFVDSEATLKNLKATEARVLDHLNRTGNLEDILGIERELNRYRQEIERIEGRLRFLENRVAFSTIQVTLTEKPKAGPIGPLKTFSTGEVASEAARSLVAFGQRVWTKIIWVAIWAPVWLPIALVVWWLARRNARAKQPGAATPPNRK